MINLLTRSKAFLKSKKITPFIFPLSIYVNHSSTNFWYNDFFALPLICLVFVYVDAEHQNHDKKNIKKKPKKQVQFVYKER